jgi:hypothetical protein
MSYPPFEYKAKRKSPQELRITFWRAFAALFGYSFKGGGTPLLPPDCRLLFDLNLRSGFL